MPLDEEPPTPAKASAMTFAAFSGVDPAARKRRPFIEALNRAIIQDEGKRLRLAAEKLLDNAATGDLGAQKELADRLDGKVPQGVALQDPDGAPLFTSIERVIIHKPVAPALTVVK
jgi:hypothetical protein